jgi:hypothetical protein
MPKFKQMFITLRMLMKKQMVVLALAAMLVSSGAFARDYFGAIYVDETTGVAGTTYNFATIEEAKAGALATCKKKSGKKSCTLILDWYNGCGAAAWSPTKKSARGAISETMVEVAEARAEIRCEELEKDPSCKTVASVCTKWDTVVTETITVW